MAARRRERVQAYSSGLQRIYELKHRADAADAAAASVAAFNALHNLDKIPHFQLRKTERIKRPTAITQDLNVS